MPFENRAQAAQEADEVVCLETPAVLYAIGYHFLDFSQVFDEDVVATLREARHDRPEAGIVASSQVHAASRSE